MGNVNNGQGPSWAPRPGEPHLALAKVSTPDGKHFVGVILKHESGFAMNFLLRPEVAEWFAEEIKKAVAIVRSGLVIPDTPQTGWSELS